jgi:hypothetical protein
MAHKNVKKEPGKAMRDSVSKEMAKPRMARSAKLAELDLNTSRIDAKLKKGARVEVTVKAKGVKPVD